MESYIGGVTNYHAANACGPNMKNGFASYEERFRCRPNDPLNLDKLNNAKRCIEGRINSMGQKSSAQYNSSSSDFLKCKKWSGICFSQTPIQILSNVCVDEFQNPNDKCLADVVVLTYCLQTFFDHL
jgi:hypothetical protein